ncbi:MAG: ABC transporter permease [Alphaproteobacteria bacterium]|nr:ABC transporter permease [Alphaproteobacteria bacterium]TAD87696.1 MAG: ABC transporter permease [Alphaproteobacteria bacterium]
MTLSRDTVTAILAPLLVAVLLIGGWEVAVTVWRINPFILPPPSAIWRALGTDFDLLASSLGLTLAVTVSAFALAAVGGALLAILFVSARWVELALLPYAIVLQVTPVVAIAPLLIIWVKDPFTAMLVLAWIVAFFPVVSNATLGLRSTDHNLLNLFQLYGASRWQQLWLLRIPNALPYYLAGLKISGGLSLIGAVVAEFVAGSGGVASGLAYRILEAGYRLQIPRMFAALFLISSAGIVIYLLLSLISHLMLRRWHESAVAREN